MLQAITAAVELMQTVPLSSLLDQVLHAHEYMFKLLKTGIEPIDVRENWPIDLVNVASWHVIGIHKTATQIMFNYE